MKTQRKHGFTIVELVVVIAVVTILAAVLIPTFVSIIKKANDSAYVQERQNQRIDDIAQKLDNETWVSWEDMEVKIAEAISNAHPSGSTLTADEVNAAIKSALEEYAVAHQSDNTGLTEAQVQKIVSEATSGNVTLEQVQALVAKIPTGSSGLTTAQVQAIVNQALAGVSASGTGLNASQVTSLINDALKSYSNTQQIQDAIAAALANFKTLSEEDVVAIVNNVTSTSASVITLTGTEAGNGYTVTSDNAGKTVYLMTNLSSTETYTISGEDVKKVVIDAPNMTDVVVACKAEEVVVVRTAMTSVHITGTVGKVEINSGHVEIESGAKVTTVTAAPSTNATVKVTVEGEVTTLNAEYQDHGTGTNDTIEIVNAGTIGTSNLTASEALETSGETTTNVSLTNVGVSTTPAPTASVAIPADTEVSVNTATTVDETPASTTPITVNASTGGGTYASYVARIGSTGYETLQAAIDAAQSGETVVLLKDVDLVNEYSITKSVTIYGSGYTVEASAANGPYSSAREGRVFDISNVSNLNISFVNVHIKGAETGVRGISLYGTSNINLVLSDCVVSANYYAINVASENTGLHVTLKNNTFSTGWCAIQSWSTGAVFDIMGGILDGNNNKPAGSSNNFSTIVVNGAATNNIWNFKNVIIKASTSTTNSQTFLSNRTTGTKVSFENCSFVYNDEEVSGLENIYDMFDLHVGSTFSKFHFDGEEYEATPYQKSTMYEYSQEGIAAINAEISSFECDAANIRGLYLDKDTNKIYVNYSLLTKIQ